MKPTASRVPHAFVAFLVAACAFVARAQTGDEAAGAAHDLAALLRTATAAASAGGDASPLAPSGQRRFQGRDLAVVLGAASTERLVVEDATLSVEVAADASSCSFELRGAPAGSGALVLAGKVVWGGGPGGGDRVELDAKMDGVDIAALRKALPGRFDSSVGGLATLHARASGVLGETTTEDAPATPLVGEFRAGADWTVLGRTSPLALEGKFSVDDRSVRIRDTSMKWQEHELALQGWFVPSADGAFELAGTFADVDAAAVAAKWGVPAQWTPTATLTGKVAFAGNKPGASLLRYEAAAASVELPAAEGWSVKATDAKLSGQLLVINADVSCSVKAASLVAGGIPLGEGIVGIRWFRNELLVSTSSPASWDGSTEATIAHKAAEHPAVRVHGLVQKVAAPKALAALAPSLGLDLDGHGALGFTTGQDTSRQPYRRMRASLLLGRLGGENLVAQLLAALARADSALALEDTATVVPQPHKGAGTRADRLFLELARDGARWDLGGILLEAGDFHFDGDGRLAADGVVSIRGTFLIPSAVVDRLESSAPWIAPLRIGGTKLFVPVAVSGAPGALRLELAEGFAGVLADARAGRPVEATRIHEVRHVVGEDVVIVPGDPSITGF